MVVVAALFKFTHLPDCTLWRERFDSLFARNKTLGTLIFAKEGVNGTVAGTREAIDELKALFMSDERFQGMEYKESFAAKNPFRRAKVKIKKEIVTMGIPLVDPIRTAPNHVTFREWNDLKKRDDVIFIDVRNDYEIEIGTFDKAVNPKTKTFREFPDFIQELLPHKDKKIAIACTGGIRCEKAGSYLKQAGFSDVDSLKGGILQYLHDCPKEESMWQGECFVFDERVSVDHDLKPGDYVFCYGCKNPLHKDQKSSPYFEEGVSCEKCFHETSEAQKAGSRSRQYQIKLAKAKGLPYPCHQ